MTRVNFYSAEVKYTGFFEDYTEKDLLEMAKAKADRGVDVFDRYEDVSEEEAKQLDGKIHYIRNYPSNKLVDIGWSYIDDCPTDFEEDEE